MLGSIAERILNLPPWLALLAVFALPALESSAFVGFIFPGEVALILGGVVASQGKVPLTFVIVAAIAGSVLGDSVGYAFGRRYARRLLDSTLGRFVNRRHFDRAEAYLARRGGKAVFFGRFTAALRVMIPGLAGMSAMRYRTFLAFNVASAVIWGTMSVLFGYLGGSSWRHVQHVASQVGLTGLAVVALVIVAAHLRHRWHPPATVPQPATGVPNTDVGAIAASDCERTVVVIPTYNEASNIVSVIDRMRVAAPAIDIVVVDDNSPDGTAHLVATHRDRRRGRTNAQGHVHLLQRTAKDGLGASYRAGFEWALDRGYEVIVQMDADRSHAPERIPALLQKLSAKDGCADVAIGSRFMPGGVVSGWSRSRWLISWAGNVYVRTVLVLPVRDTTAGFKAFRADALRAIAVTDSASDGYCFQIETTWRAVRLGLRVAEVPSSFADRTAGTSKMSIATVVEALSRVLAWRWDEVVRRHRLTPAKPPSADPSSKSSGHAAA